jgi:RimJ/RimL family protein N-acetyltransferase
VALRPWREADLPAVVAACNDPLIARYTTVPSPYEEHHARKWLTAQEPARLAGTGIDLAIAPSADPDAGMLGAIGMFAIDARAARARIGYWVASGERGRGLATTALRLLAGWAFETLALERLELITDPDNAASQRVAQQAGFERRGFLPARPGPGGHRDAILFDRRALS